MTNTTPASSTATSAAASAPASNPAPIRLIVATHNEGKLTEIRAVLAQRLGDEASRFDIVTAGSLGLPDPVEDGVSFEENALIKARDVARRTGSPALADDSGLIVDVMGGAPGILSARWAGKHGDDAANNRLLLAQMEDIPDAHRGARFVCCMALVVPLADGGFEERTVQGVMPGRLLHAPHGTNGFGYDPLFVPNEQPIRGAESVEPGALEFTEVADDEPAEQLLTSADMTPAEKNAISHRGRAIRAMVPIIEDLLLH